MKMFQKDVVEVVFKMQSRNNNKNLYRSLISSKEDREKICSTCRSKGICIAEYDFVNYHCERLEKEPNQKFMKFYEDLGVF